MSPYFSCSGCLFLLRTHTFFFYDLCAIWRHTHFTNLEHILIFLRFVKSGSILPLYRPTHRSDDLPLYLSQAVRIASCLLQDVPAGNLRPKSESMGG